MLSKVTDFQVLSHAQTYSSGVKFPMEKPIVANVTWVTGIGPFKKEHRATIYKEFPASKLWKFYESGETFPCHEEAENRLSAYLVQKNFEADNEK